MRGDEDERTRLEYKNDTKRARAQKTKTNHKPQNHKPHKYQPTKETDSETDFTLVRVDSLIGIVTFSRLPLRLHCLRNEQTTEMETTTEKMGSLYAEEGKNLLSHELSEEDLDETQFFTPVTTPRKTSLMVDAENNAPSSPSLVVGDGSGPPNIKESHRRWKAANNKAFWERRLACRRSNKQSRDRRPSKSAEAKLKIDRALYESIQGARETNPWDYFLGEVVEECAEEVLCEAAQLKEVDHNVEHLFHSSIKRRLDFMFEDLSDEDVFTDENMLQT